MLRIHNLFFSKNNTSFLFNTIRLIHRNLGIGNSWKGKSLTGYFHRELPKNVKPTHIIVGAGSAGCVLVF